MNPQKIAFLVDSCADLLPRHLEGRPIYIVPLRISCADGEYDDGENITSADVYVRQERGELPKTSLPDMLRVNSTLNQIRADGYERVIALPLSSGLSGTHSMIRMQCVERKDLEAVAFDTRSGSLGIGMVVMQLWEDIQQGMEWDELIQKRVPFLMANTHPYFSVDTLEYLQKGGRIGKIAAMAGTLMSIKPLLTFAEDGQLVNCAKVRGRKAVQGKLVELVYAHLGTHKRFNLAIANGGAPEEMKELEAKVREAFPGCGAIMSSDMDATLSVYVGKGMLGAAIQLLD